ncbi:hypothetical protein ACH4YO_42510 [Streptomyces noursei]|uniref:hypothetical protein n=1 Tax=Streptomyces noursei TaxID=1971 RepID=UPI0033EFF2EE
MKNILTISTACCLILVNPMDFTQGAEPQWQLAGEGITCGISGLAVEEPSTNLEAEVDLISVRDNKKYEDSRVARIRLHPGKNLKPAKGPCKNDSKESGKKSDIEELKWTGTRELPQDLEAIDNIPGATGSYAAVASKGYLYQFSVDKGTAKARSDPGPLPGVQVGDNYESFALGKICGSVFAVWATRGKNNLPSKVRTAEATLKGGKLTLGKVINKEDFTAPEPNLNWLDRKKFPKGEVRHISDLKILRNGTLLISSALDSNKNDGGYGSAIYNAGKLTKGGHLNLTKSSPLKPLRKFTADTNKKVEAVVDLGDRQVWGTDDENLGGYLMMDQVRFSGVDHEGEDGCGG